MEVLDTHAELANYLRLGGFPAVHLQNYTPDEVYTIVRDIYNSTIFTDIVRRNQIRKVDQLERIVKFAFDNLGRTFSAASISKYLKSEPLTMKPFITISASWKALIFSTAAHVLTCKARKS